MLESLMNYVPYQEPPVPEVPGVFYQGGYYVGKIRIGAQIYALITAPRALGESDVLQWSVNNNDTPGTYSLTDGWVNTLAMIAAGADLFPIAKYCRSLVIDGYDDWYVPSVNELEMLYRQFKPTSDANNSGGTAPNAGGMGYNPASIPIGAAYTATVPPMTTITSFQSPNSESFSSAFYWSSSSNLAAYPWSQNFRNGNQNGSSYPKTSTRRVRAVRRVLIEEI